MDISFISVNFRSGAVLRRALQSLVSELGRTSLSVEYIVINNDPTEKTLIESLKQDFPQLQTIHSPENLGFGRANKLGSETATGEILFFINPDTVFLGGNFQSLREAFRYRPKAIYGMALQVSSGGRERFSSGVFPSLLRLLQSNLPIQTMSAPWKAKEVREVDWVSGAALAIRKDFFKALGGFDPSFFLYFEDVDLARRGKAQGAWVGVYPFLRFLHLGGKSSDSQSTQKHFFYKSQLRYFKKWRPWYESAVLYSLQRLFRYS